MPRRLILPLLAAIALLFAAAPAALAAAPLTNGGPSAHAATEDDASEESAGDEEDCSDEFAIEAEDGTIVCGDDPDLGDEGDVDELCDDGWGYDDDGSSDDPEAEAATREDDCAADESAAAAPHLSALQATVAGKGRKLRVRVGFRLDVAGEVRLTLERVEAAASGRRKQCAAAAARRSARDAKSCSRGTAVRGSVDVKGRGGANTTELPRRWNGRALAPGSYRLTATPRAAGGVGMTTTFRLAAPAKR